jgi:uncharacterized membrane protein YphA (DoxX/SURF4 family)
MMLPHIAGITVDFVGGILIDLGFLTPFSSGVTFARNASATRFRIQYAAWSGVFRPGGVHHRRAEQHNVRDDQSSQ